MVGRDDRNAREHPTAGSDFAVGKCSSIHQIIGQVLNFFPDSLRAPCYCESKRAILTEVQPTNYSTSKFDTKPFKIKRARRRKEARLATMNIFRFLGDMTHLLSIIVRVVHLTHGCNVHTPPVCTDEGSFVWNRCCS